MIAMGSLFENAYNNYSAPAADPNWRSWLRARATIVAL